MLTGLRALRTFLVTSNHEMALGPLPAHQTSIITSSTTHIAPAPLAASCYMHSAPCPVAVLAWHRGRARDTGQRQKAESACIDSACIPGAGQTHISNVRHFFAHACGHGQLHKHPCLSSTLHREAPGAHTAGCERGQRNRNLPNRPAQPTYPQEKREKRRERRSRPQGSAVRHTHMLCMLVHRDPHMKRLSAPTAVQSTALSQQRLQKIACGNKHTRCITTACRRCPKLSPHSPCSALPCPVLAAHGLAV